MKKRINRYTVKLIRENTGLYELDNAFITSPGKAHSVIDIVLGLNDEAVEKFGMIALDTKNKIAGIHILSIGSLNASIVHPREVFKNAILNNASGIILFHNHPSGDPTPSKEDIETTKRISSAGNIMGINVIDHVIVGDKQYYSLKEHDEME